MKVSYGVKNNTVWYQVGKISVEDYYDELVASGEYVNEWLADCHSIYVPKNDEIPYIAYHFYSGGIRVVGARLDITVDVLDVVCWLLSYGNLSEMISFQEGTMSQLF